MSDDAWVIFTSGSTGVPKGVAVSHRSAAAFVDAEARMFLQDSPIGPGDRVLAGLSVAFDASCEEMWLAWGHGACLVPAPRSLVRTGMDLGPWLVAQEVTVVSTVPTLAALWPAEALEPVRLLVFGGEACPPELAERLVTPEREVWNTYGPTEATVVACGARLDGTPRSASACPSTAGTSPSSARTTSPSPPGETGQLIIGGVGLARYLDPVKDAEKYAAMPTLGWDRAYRSGDLVVNDPEGLVFVGRADEQVKLGGRRIELGEIDAALQSLPHVSGAAAAVRTTGAGSQVLVGYVVPAPRQRTFDRKEALARLHEELRRLSCRARPRRDAARRRTSGKVDRAALPWPLPDTDDDEPSELSGTAAWLADHWTAVLGTTVRSAEADFFDHGGGSLSSARLVSLLRERYPTVTVADVHAHPRLGAQADLLDTMDAADGSRVDRTVRRIPRRTQARADGRVGRPPLGQGPAVARRAGHPDRAAAALRARGVVRARVVVGPRRRVGRVHQPARADGLVRPGRSRCCSPVCVRAATRAAGACSCGSGPPSASPTRWAPSPWPARRGSSTTRGCSAPRSVPASTSTRVPPVTGMLTIGAGASIEPEVDLSGYWIDGDVVHVGPVHIGREAVVGARSTIGPDVHIGREVVVEAGSDRAEVRAPRARRRRVARAARDRPGPRRVARRATARGSGVARGLRDLRSSSCRSCPSSRCSPGCCSSAGRRASAEAHDVVGTAYAAVPSRDGARPGHPRSGHHRARAPPRRSGCGRATTRCGAGSDGRCGPPSDCSTRPARCSSRSTRASSRRGGCAPWAPRSARRRGLDGAPAAVDDVDRGRGLPRRRHHGRRLRARPWLGAHRSRPRSASAPSSATAG